MHIFSILDNFDTNSTEGKNSLTDSTKWVKSLANSAKRCEEKTLQALNVIRLGWLFIVYPTINKIINKDFFQRRFSSSKVNMLR